MKPCKDIPCNNCPMRRASLPGWLGGDVPEHFIQTVHSEANMPCHLTVNYEDPNWELQLMPGGSATECAGIAIYRANVLKSLRDASVRRLPKDKVNVFSSPTEFLAHHRKGPRWNEAKKDFEWPKKKASAAQRKARAKVR